MHTLRVVSLISESMRDMIGGNLILILLIRFHRMLADLK